MQQNWKVVCACVKPSLLIMCVTSNDVKCVTCLLQDQSDGYQLLVLAPLCELLGPFATSSGLNPTGTPFVTCFACSMSETCMFDMFGSILSLGTGEGMRRMVQLALKRARASAPVQIRVIQPSRDSDDRRLERLRMDTFDRNDDAQDYENDDDVSRMTINSERG